MATSIINGTTGTYYTCAWTATTSSANNTKLTGQQTLPVGVYIMVGNAPTVSASNYLVKIHNLATGHYHTITTGSTFCEVIKIDEPATVYISSSSSTICTFSDISRGYARFVRVA